MSGGWKSEAQGEWVRWERGGRRHVGWRVGGKREQGRSG